MGQAALFQIALMIIFRGIERGRGFDLRDDGPRKPATLIQAGLRLFRGRLLLGCVIKNHGTILVAHIGSLTIERGRIVVRPENIEKLIVTDDRGIELHLHHFGVPGAVAAHILIGRIRRRAARIAHSGIRHAAGGAKGGFDAPKTAGAKCRFFSRHGFTMKREAVTRKCSPPSGKDASPKRPTGGGDVFPPGENRTRSFAYITIPPSTARTWPVI